jgi:iron complex transport system substrate-binding protein
MGILLAMIAGAAAGAEPITFPLHLRDTLGRQVTLQALPQRVVSLAPSNTERLFAVGAGAALVGVTLYDTYPAEVQQLEKVGGFAAASLSIEKIVALRPDVVLAAGDIQRPAIESLARLGLNVVAIEDPRHFEDVYTTIELVGQIMGRLQTAQQVVTTMRQHVARVQRLVATVPLQERVTVFYEIFDQPLMTVGASTLIGQMLEMAGGINIFADVSQRYVQVSAEEVIRRNPDCILGFDRARATMTVARLKQRPGWEHITAVQQQCIHFLDDDTIARPGPRVAAGLEIIARALYPRLFP